MLEIIKIFISSVIMMITIYIFGALTTDNKRINKKRKIISIIVFSMLYTIIYLFTRGTTKTILFCITYGIFIKMVFNTTITKASIISIIYVLLNIIPEFTILGVATQILNISKEYYHINIAGGIIGNILTFIVMLIVTLILKKPLKKLFSYNISTSKKIIFISFLTLTSLAIFFYNLINTYRLNKDIFGYLIVIITLIVILFYLFKQKIDNEAISKKYDDLLNIMKNYESDIEEQRIMIHETRNELMTIKSKINDNEKQMAIIDYIDSILGDKVSSKMSKYSKFKYLPSNGIKGFFYYKFTEAEKRGIKVSVNISKKIESSFLGNLETKDFKNLVRIIGVYLDNAIEASYDSKEKKLGIEIYLIKKDIDIIISNTFDNEVNNEKIGFERFTTKGKNRGHGLLLVKHILHGNTIFESSSEIKDHIYTQRLKIINSNKKTQ